MLSRQHLTATPAPSTVADLLRREELASRVGGAGGHDPRQPFAAVVAPNDAWCIDFETGPRPMAHAAIH